jgi:hypothetical protein
MPIVTDPQRAPAATRPDIGMAAVSPDTGFILGSNFYRRAGACGVHQIGKFF